MLKTYPTTFLLPKRIKLASLAARCEPDTTPAQQTSHNSTLSTDASFSPQEDPRQPILLARHRTMSQANTDSAPRTQRMTGAYFPLGYKEAAQQWVGSLC